MASIGTFGSFTQARLGIYAAQQGMSVTGNNISNINTKGYTRQRLDQVSIPGGTFDRYASHGVNVGYGALTTGVSQLRDPYLDIRYREKLADLGAMEAKLSALTNVNDILNDVAKGEDGFGIIGSQFDDLIKCLQQISDQTGHDNHDNLVRGSAEALCRKFNSYANQLEQVRQNMDMNLRQNVDTINENLKTIRDLNATIRKCEIHGDNALELRDRRNTIIDELSELMKINVTYEMENLGGGLQVEKLKITLDNANPDASVRTDEVSLVDGVYAAQMEFPEKVPQLNPLYDPTDPNSFKYLGAAGATPDKDLANQVANENYDLHVTELVDSYGKAMQYVEKVEEHQIELKGIEFDFNGEDEKTTFVTALQEAFPGMTETEAKDIAEKTGEENRKNALLDLLQTKKDFLGKVDPITGAQGKTRYLRPEINKDGVLISTMVTITPSQGVDLDDNDLYGVIQSQREFLTEKGEFSTQSDVNLVDEGAASKRGVQYYQRVLDSLARQVADSMNAANTGFLYDENENFLKKTMVDGKPVYEAVPANSYTPPQTYRKLPNGTFTPDENGTYYKKQNEENYISADDYAKQVSVAKNKTDADALPKLEPKDPADKQELTPQHSYSAPEQAYLKSLGVEPAGGNLFSNRSDKNDGTGITAANISIAHQWSNGPMIVRSYLKPSHMDDVASTDSSNITHLITLFDKKMDYLPSEFVENPSGGGEPMFHGTFLEMWNKVGTTLGDDMKFTETMMEVFNKSAVSLDMQRDSMASVDLNDEAMNLMQYSKSYNAACRLMTTLDSMLDKLINGTGMIT